MASISSNSVQSVNQASFQQIKLLEARRSAAQAEQTAQRLQSQAGQAQRVADRAQENARSVTVQADQAQDNAGRARQGLALIRSTEDAGNQLAHFASQVAERNPVDSTTAAPAAAVTIAAPATNTAPVINTQGQVTGALVNTTA